MRVLLTGARAPVTLDLARRFHAQGHAVFLADSLRFGVAAFSRAVTRMLVVPAPKASAARYVDALLGAVDRWKIDLLVPTCEEVFFIAHHLDRFRDVCAVCTDSLEKLERMHNKWKFSQKRYSEHAQAPESHLLNDTTHLEPFHADSANWVFKPVYSRFAAETRIGPDAAALASVRPSAAKPWIAQRRIVGQEYSTYSVARAGRLQAHAVYRSEYKVGVGSGIYFIACQQPAIEAFVRDFVAAESYTGQIGFDVIVDAEGKPWVLEANPRATSGVHLFAPRDALIEAIVGEVADCVRPSASAPPMLGLALAVFGLRMRGLGKLVRDFVRARDVVFAWSDPLPTLLLPLAVAEIAGIAWRERRQLTEAATYDIEWNGEPL